MTTELNPMDKESKMVLLTLYSFIHDSWRLGIYSLIFHLLKYSWSSPTSTSMFLLLLLLLLYVCVSLFSSCHKKCIRWSVLGLNGISCAHVFFDSRFDCIVCRRFVHFIFFLLSNFIHLNTENRQRCRHCFVAY